MDITQALLATLQQDANLRNQAENYLNGLEKQNLPVFLLTLVGELANETKPSLSRKAAGLKLKNIFESRIKETKQLLAVQWAKIAPDTKTQIKQTVLNILHSPVKEARNTAAQILSTLTIIELGQEQWLDVIDHLCATVTQPRTEFGVEAALITIGYICEECESPILQSRSNAILTSVIQGFRSDQKNLEIRAAAGGALLNILSFIKSNFQNDSERNFILRTICEATQAPSEDVRHVAMESLVSIASLYYEKLKDYMDALYNITFKAAKTDVEKVALQAIEFWLTIGETEEEINENIKFAQENQQPPPQRVTFNFIRAALQNLVQLITELLVIQDEQQAEEDELTRNTSASTLLACIARVVGDDVVGTIMPFISQNINSTNWKFMEAATIAFSAILDGPTSKDKMKSLVNQAIPVMFGHIQAKEAAVRETTIFTIGRIAQFHCNVLIEGGHLENVIKASLLLLKDTSRVASKAAWCLYNVAENLEPDNPETVTSPISPYFVVLVRELLTASERADGDEANLRLNVYGALSTVISAAPRDQFQHLENIAGVIIQKLSATLRQSNLSVQDREELYSVQNSLARILYTLTHKLGSAVNKLADQLMTLYLNVFQYRNAISEETMMAIGGLASAMGKPFEKYMPHLKPFLLVALKNKSETQVCTVAVNTVGDLCFAVENAILPLCDEIMSTYINHLQDAQVSRHVKPLIIASFGDIALAIGPSFEKYIKHVAMILKKASEMGIESPTDEMIEHHNLLRENIFEAYTGILQALKKDKQNTFLLMVDDLVNFIKTIAHDDTVDEDLFSKAVSMIGDLANIYGAQIKPLLENQFIRDMVEEAMKSNDKKVQEIGKWAFKQLKKVLQ